MRRIFDDLRKGNCSHLSYITCNDFYGSEAAPDSFSCETSNIYVTYSLTVSVYMENYALRLHNVTY